MPRTDPLHSRLAAERLNWQNAQMERWAREIGDSLGFRMFEVPK